MADFDQAYERTVTNEGGYKLTTTPGDRGGMTYAGISRKFHPTWRGWDFIDDKMVPPSQLVRDFYRSEFWDKLNLSQISDQRIAQTIYDFGVNADWRVSAKLAQIVAGVTPDGVIGEKSIQAINAANPDTFHLAFALAKVRRYAEIVTRDKSQGVFLLGWINRTLKELA